MEATTSAAKAKSMIERSPNNRVNPAAGLTNGAGRVPPLAAAGYAQRSRSGLLAVSSYPFANPADLPHDTARSAPRMWSQTHDKSRVPICLAMSAKCNGLSACLG